MFILFAQMYENVYKTLSCNATLSAEIKIFERQFTPFASILTLCCNSKNMWENNTCIALDKVDGRICVYLLSSAVAYYQIVFPHSKVHGANMGPIWDQQDSGGPHVGPHEEPCYLGCLRLFDLLAYFWLVWLAIRDLYRMITPCSSK